MNNEKLQTTTASELEEFALDDEQIFTAKVMAPYCILAGGYDLLFSHAAFLPIAGTVIAGGALYWMGAPALYELEQRTHVLTHVKNMIARKLRGQANNLAQIAGDGNKNTPVATQIAAPGAQNTGAELARLTVDECANYVEFNTFKVCIGRSLTTGEAVVIGFYRKHMKLIGSSQKGKSSMAAALLDAITRTHDTSRVLIALLDFEDMTSKLFAHLPHLAELQTPDGQIVPLHARTYEQVLDYLCYIADEVNVRYGMSKVEMKDTPLLIVYFEEFLSFKDYLKKRVAMASGQAARDLAQQDYARFTNALGVISRLGLKARVQLLLCAQADYVDDDKDMRDALINVNSGFSFAVRPSAAQAAGFMDAPLLTRNARDNKVGQAVVEMPDCHDLILAPEYDLEARLVEFEERELDAERAAGIGRLATSQRSLLTARNGQRSAPAAQNIGDLARLEEKITALLAAAQNSGQIAAPVAPAIDGDLARVIEAYQNGARSLEALAVATGKSVWEIRKIMPAVKRELGIA